MALTFREIRGERQWKAAVDNWTAIENLHIKGPPGLSLDGLERMSNLKQVTFWLGAPVDQLRRLAGLEQLEKVTVQLGRAPHDARSLLACRIPELAMVAFDARRALEVAEIPWQRISVLRSLLLDNKSSALVRWRCDWLPAAEELRELMISGYVPADAESHAALRGATQLRKLWWHDDDGKAEPAWRDELHAALPDAEIKAWRWHAGSHELGERWAFDVIEQGEQSLEVAVLGPRELARATTVPSDAADLRRILERWVPDLAKRVTVEDTPAGITIMGLLYRPDLAFVQDLLEAGTPDGPGPGAAPSPAATAIEDPALAALAVTFIDEVRAGRYDNDVEAAVNAWRGRLRELEAQGGETDYDTMVREQLYEVLREPLNAAGIDPEAIAAAF